MAGTVERLEERPVRPDTTDWSTRLQSQATDGKQTVNLDTKYFSLAVPPAPAATPDPGLNYVTGRPGLVLRKVKGRMKTSSTEVAATTESLCGGEVLECGAGPGNTSSPGESRGADQISPAFPNYEELLKHFKKEVWVIPVLAAAGSIILILLIFEIFLLAKTVRGNPSRRHLFLGQMLLLGLLSCAGMAVVFTLQPSPLTCAVIRLGSGLAYSTVYSTLLVKLVFLISLNSGVYLPATYQSLLLCFAILIQIVIGVQWLVSAPPDTAQLEEGGPLQCATQFTQQLLGKILILHKCSATRPALFL